MDNPVSTRQSVISRQRTAPNALAVMAAAGVLVLLGGRSETIRGLRGDGRDERFAQIDLRGRSGRAHRFLSS